MTVTEPSPVLAPKTIYVAYDRFVCDKPSCAGMSALYTGVTIGGAPLEPLSPEDVFSWPVRELGALCCECGTLEAVPAGGGFRIIEVAR